jgi:hypothetical protein
MPEAGPAPTPPNPPSRLPSLGPDPAHKPKLLDYPYTNAQFLKIPFGKLLSKFLELTMKRCLFSFVAAMPDYGHYNPRPDFRHGLFHLAHVDLFKTKTSSPLEDYVVVGGGQKNLFQMQSDFFYP